MDYPRRDPVDHERTTRQHAGESVKNAANAPGLAGMAVAAVALIVGLFAKATRHLVVGCVAVILAAVCAAAAAGWLVFADHRVRQAELQQMGSQSIPTHPAQQLTAHRVACVRQDWVEAPTAVNCRARNFFGEMGVNGS